MRFNAPPALLRACAALALILLTAACGGTSSGQDDDFTAEETPTPHAVVATPTPTEEPEPVDSDGDGVTDDVDDFPTDASRHSVDDWDGDGIANATDAVPDDPAMSAWPTDVVFHVLDGDTVDVEVHGRVRIIGIDTPERGQCGYQNATDLMEYLVLGKEVTLVPGARDDRDRYGRLLRYIDVDGKDAGREMIGSGWAIARYDSRDGYGAHPREGDYVVLDAQVPDKTCPAPAPAPAPAQPAPAPAAPAGEPWNMPGPDLDCGDIGHPVLITGPDYHRLDRDGDGRACESYG